MEGKIFEVKSFARIKFLEKGNFSKTISSKEINFFDTIFFEEKKRSENSGVVEIRKTGKIKFPTNSLNSSFLAAKEMQKFFAKKNIGKKPNGLKILIKKEIPLNSGLSGSVSNASCTIDFLNNFWDINFSKKDLINVKKEILEKIFGDYFFSDQLFFSNEKEIFLFKSKIQIKILILIPKYISVDKEFFYKNLDGKNNFLKAQRKIKKIFPDLERIISIFLKNGSEFSDISGKGGAVFGVFKKNISEEKINYLKKIFEKYGELKIL